MKEKGKWSARGIRRKKKGEKEKIKTMDKKQKKIGRNGDYDEANKEKREEEKMKERMKKEGSKDEEEEKKKV